VDAARAGERRHHKHQHHERDRPERVLERDPDDRADRGELDDRAQGRRDDAPVVPETGVPGRSDTDRDQQRQDDNGGESQPGVERHPAI
jgi:hypothetical protein